jgi:hypothetical protein
LGRHTQNVPNPQNPSEILPSGDLKGTPHPIQTLVDEIFHAVKVTTGNSFSAALDLEGWF